MGTGLIFAEKLYISNGAPPMAPKVIGSGPQQERAETKSLAWCISFLTLCHTTEPFYSSISPSSLFFPSPFSGIDSHLILSPPVLCLRGIVAHDAAREQVPGPLLYKVEFH